MVRPALRRRIISGEENCSHGIWSERFRKREIYNKPGNDCKRNLVLILFNFANVIMVCGPTHKECQWFGKTFGIYLMIQTVFFESRYIWAHRLNLSNCSVYANYSPIYGWIKVHLYYWEAMIVLMVLLTHFCGCISKYIVCFTCVLVTVIIEK